MTKPIPPVTSSVDEGSITVLDNQVSAVDKDRASGDVARFVGREKHSCSNHFLRPGGPMHGNPVQQPLTMRSPCTALVGVHPALIAAIGESWCQCVHPDPVIDKI